MYRRDLKCQQGGEGVLLAINKNFISDEVEELHPGNDCEIIWAKLDIKGSKTLYISPFYNPKTSDEKSLTNFDISVRRASQIQNAALFIGGDFNLPGWDWKNRILKPNAVHPKDHYEFGNTLVDTGLVQLIEQPTRQDNILDLMITNLPNQIPRAEIITGISDHDIVFVELNIAPTKLRQKPRNIPIYRKANWETMKTESDTLYNDMTGVVSTSSAEDLWIDFKTNLENIVKHHIPFKKLSAKIKPPWITHDTKKLMKKRDIKLQNNEKIWQQTTTRQI